MFKNTKKQNKIKINTGFAILFSVLMASFLITLGISIFSISLKEIMITTSTRDSQIAYYIADSARECALYWDVKQGAFPTCLDDACTPALRNPSTNPIKCNGKDITLTFSQKDALTFYTGVDPVSNFFQASSSLLSAPVADISITKNWSSTFDKVITTIEARGHNTGIIGRRVERGIQQINN